jgi:hypothetical protein
MKFEKGSNAASRVACRVQVNLVGCSHRNFLGGTLGTPFSHRHHGGQAGVREKFPTREKNVVAAALCLRYRRNAVAWTECILAG